METVVRDLATGAAAVGHTVTVLTAGKTEGTFVRDGVRVVRSRTLLELRNVPLSPGLLRDVLTSRADVLHVHEPSVLPEAAMALAGGRLRRRHPVLALSWHSDIVRQQILLRVVGPTLERALKAADVVFAASPHHLTSSPWLARYEEKVAIVPYGVDPQRYRADGKVAARVEELRERYGGSLVLFLGRLVYYKGVDRLLAAAEALPDGRFLLVGDGPLAPMVRASPAARSGRLTLIGPVDEAEKVALLHAADVVVLPSTAKSEAYGIVLVEAMACGRPVVTYDLPTGVTWLNRDGENGLVARLDEQGSLAAALAALLADRGLRTTLGAAGRTRVEAELTLEQQVEATLAAYRGAGRVVPEVRR